MTGTKDAQAATPIASGVPRLDAAVVVPGAAHAAATSTAPVAEVPSGLVIARLTDAEVLGRLEQAFADRRRVDAVIARLAGEVANRSRPSLGADGLARRYGATNPGALVASVGLVSQAEGRRYCRVGEATAIRTTLGGEPLPPSYPVLASALNAGAITVEAAQLIVTAL